MTVIRAFVFFLLATLLGGCGPDMEALMELCLEYEGSFLGAYNSKTGVELEGDATPVKGSIAIDINAERNWIVSCAIPPEPIAFDFDGDGVPMGEDCNDSDATVFPGAEEWCDGVDNDCDGIKDNEAADAIAFHPDEDGDGYPWGREVMEGWYFYEVRACTQPIGYVRADLPQDCDDSDPHLYPGAGC